MKEQSRKKVFYICFYAEPEIANKIVSYPSVWSKIDYVVSGIKDAGVPVELLSVARSTNGRFKGFKKTIDNKERHIYFSSTCWKSSLLNKLSTVGSWIKTLMYLLIHAKSNDTVIVYHSIHHLRWLNIYHNVFRRPFCLEIEDVFSALSDNAKKFEKAEWALFRQADACICVNDLIAEKLDCVNNKIISYGSYMLPKYKRERNDDKIRLVYAGVIEQERCAAFLAVNTMRHLSSRYSLSVLGFGNQENVDALNKLINEVNTITGFNNIEFCGRMSGEDYYRFLQNCDIGLSTHTYDESNMSSADNTFPSKVLVYMANGLRVVAQRIACLEKSKLSDCLVYYDNPNSEEVAKAIMDIDASKPCDGRKWITELAQEFESDLRQLLKTSR